MIITEGRETPPLTLGPQRLHYGFSVALPQAHLTFASIVQGIAFGILLQDWPLPGSRPLSDLWPFFVEQHAYLPWIVSTTVIIVIWKQFVHASVFVPWPLSSMQIGLMLLISLAEITAFRSIDQFGFWVLSIGSVGIVGGFIRLNNLRLQRRADFALAKAFADQERFQWVAGSLYLALGFMYIVLGAILQYTHLLAQYRSQAAWVVLVILICTLAGVVALDSYSSDNLTNDLTANSDLESNGIGGIQYSRSSRHINQSSGR